MDKQYAPLSNNSRGIHYTQRKTNRAGLKPSAPKAIPGERDGTADVFLEFHLRATWCISAPQIVNQRDIPRKEAPSNTAGTWRQTFSTTVLIPATSARRVQPQMREGNGVLGALHIGKNQGGFILKNALRDGTCKLGGGGRWGNKRNSTHSVKMREVLGAGAPVSRAQGSDQVWFLSWRQDISATTARQRTPPPSARDHHTAPKTPAPDQSNANTVQPSNTPRSQINGA